MLYSDAVRLLWELEDFLKSASTGEHRVFEDYSDEEIRQALLAVLTLVDEEDVAASDIEAKEDDATQ